MPDKPLSLGQAIDQVIAALEPLDQTSRQTVLTAVTSHLGLTIAAQVGADNPPSANQKAPATDPSPPASEGKPSTTVDIRTLKEEKNPESAQQMVCVVGLYLQELAPENERLESFKPADVEKYFKQANFPLPNNVGQTLRDAKKAGYVESVSRGEYKLNAVGYNLAAHRLPKSKSN